MTDKERRQYERIKKSFILSYFNQFDPDQRYEITQLKNISIGGMCFVTTQHWEKETELSVELKTPYLAGTTYLTGTVVGCHEKMKDNIYETRLQFNLLQPDAKVVLEKLIELFVQ